MNDSTHQNTELSLPPEKPNDKEASLDQMLTTMCLGHTVNEVIQMKDKALRARTYFCASLIYNAIFETDIAAIKEIAQRIDGTIPMENERDKFANIVGDAIEDIMEYQSSEDLRVYPDDIVVIALAKAVYYLATREVGKNAAARKDRQQAIEMILTRVGGRKTEPVRETMTLEYVEPDWMHQLPE